MNDSERRKRKKRRLQRKEHDITCTDLQAASEYNYCNTRRVRKTQISTESSAATLYTLNNPRNNRINVLSHVTYFPSNFVARSAHTTLGKLNSKYNYIIENYTVI